MESTVPKNRKDHHTRATHNHQKVVTKRSTVFILNETRFASSNDDRTRMFDGRKNLCRATPQMTLTRIAARVNCESCSASHGYPIVPITFVRKPGSPKDQCSVSGISRNTHLLATVCLSGLKIIPTIGNSVCE